MQTFKAMVSLDTFHGLMMFWLIGVDAMEKELQALHPDFLTKSLAYELNHTFC